MKKTDIKKLKKELANIKTGKPHRFGIEYAWYNAHALDQGIITRQLNARKWRKKVIELSERGVVTERKSVFVRDKYVGMRHRFKGTAYYLNGEIKFYVSYGKIIEHDESYKIEKP